MLAVVLTGAPAGLGGNTAAPWLWRARLRQPCTRLAFRPCDIATFATDPPALRTAPAPTPSTAHCAACALRLSLLPSCPPSSLMDTIIGVSPQPFKVPRLDAYSIFAIWIADRTSSGLLPPGTYTNSIQVTPVSRFTAMSATALQWHRPVARWLELGSTTRLS